MKRRSWAPALASTALVGLVVHQGVERELAAPRPARAGERAVEVRGLPPGVTDEMVRQGAALFGGHARCFKCHGRDARGTKRGPDLTDSRWIHIDGELEEIVRITDSGVRNPKEHPLPMPPRGNAKLSDEQVRALAAYIYSLSH